MHTYTALLLLAQAVSGELLHHHHHHHHNNVNKLEKRQDDTTTTRKEVVLATTLATVTITVTDDGIPDLWAPTIDANRDGIPDLFPTGIVDADGNGIPDWHPNGDGAQTTTVTKTAVPVFPTAAAAIPTTPNSPAVQQVESKTAAAYVPPAATTTKEAAVNTPTPVPASNSQDDTPVSSGDNSGSGDTPVYVPVEDDDNVLITSPKGKWPPQVKSVQELGQLKDKQWTGGRDVGSSGLLNGKGIWVFGDTISKTGEQMTGLVPNSAAYAVIGNPTLSEFVTLDEKNRPRQFIPFTDKEYNFWKANDFSGSRRPGLWTSIVADKGTGEGVVFFVKNTFSGKTLADISYDGVGVAPVTSDDHGPTAQRVSDFIFDDSGPEWGALSTVVSGGYIYAFGVKANVVYVARVPVGQEQSRSKYTFWNGSKWVSNFSETSDYQILWGIQVGTFFRSSYFGNKWVVVYNTKWSDYKIMMKTADNLTGPWSEATELYTTKKASGQKLANYCMYGHPYFTGSVSMNLDTNSLIVSWTSPAEGGVQLAKVTFA